MDKLRAMALSAAILLPACTELPLSPEDAARLDVAAQQWAARGYRDYSIDVVHICDCPPSLRGRARIEVVNDTIKRVILLGTLAIITDQRLERYHTVEDLFEVVRQAQTDHTWERVTFTLDPVLGLPTYVHWDPKPGAENLDLILLVSNPQPLSPFLSSR